MIGLRDTERDAYPLSALGWNDLRSAVVTRSELSDVSILTGCPCPFTTGVLWTGGGDESLLSSYTRATRCPLTFTFALPGRLSGRESWPVELVGDTASSRIGTALRVLRRERVGGFDDGAPSSVDVEDVAETGGGAGGRE